MLNILSKISLILIFSIPFQANGHSGFNNEKKKFAEQLSMAKNQFEVLNQLKNEINDYYGLDKGNPRINSGPCGPFANLFYQKWNERFVDKVSISFVMSPDSSECYHILIKLPETNYYYDGGSGVIKKKTLLNGFEKGIYIIDMLVYNFDLLNEMAYGLERTYKGCPNYSNSKTSEIIDKYLKLIKRDMIAN